jgi:hypothetical protein
MFELPHLGHPQAAGGAEHAGLRFIIAIKLHIGSRRAEGLQLPATAPWR